MNPAEIQRRELLHRIHVLRWQEHWGKNYDAAQQPWPRSDADWRQTPHGAPWDSNVLMAEWHLSFARKLIDEGLAE
jgi:hypothetical protein